MFQHFTESDRVQPDINLLLREETNLSNIYLARYNMYNLDPNAKNMFTNGDYDNLYNFLAREMYNGNKPGGVDLIRLGYFSLELPLNLDHKLDYGNPILSYLSMGDEPQVLNTEQFKQFYTTNDHKFKDVFHFILKKVHYEMFLRTKQKVEFSIDLYYNRSPGSANMFHYDSDGLNQFRQVDFFSLSYIIPDNIIMKGLSIISKNINYTVDQPMLTLVVKNGSSLCLDNNYFFHATPSTTTGTNWVYGSDQNRQQNITEQFSAQIIVPGQGEELIPFTDPITRRPYKLGNDPFGNVQPIGYMSTTRKTPPFSNTPINVLQKRSFIRTWHFARIEPPRDVFTINYNKSELQFGSFNNLNKIITYPDTNFTIRGDTVDQTLSNLSDKMSLGGKKLLDDTIIGNAEEPLDNTILNNKEKLLDNQTLNKKEESSDNQTPTLEIDKQLFDKINQLNNINKVFENPNTNFIIYNNKDNKIKGGGFRSLNKKRINFNIKNKTKNRRKNRTKNRRKNRSKNRTKNRRKNITKNRTKNRRKNITKNRSKS